MLATKAFVHLIDLSQRRKRIPARVNGIFNHAYCNASSSIERRYDPMLGITHHDGDGAPVFVFDMMEPERPKVDRAVLAALKSEASQPADLTIRDDGVVRLSSEIASWVATFAYVMQHFGVVGEKKLSSRLSGVF
jgi:CRISPR/Cas system-associated endonuclease Cas1